VPELSGLGIAEIIAFLLAITAHELAHAVVAVKLGDPTPRLMGRLSLNPIKHLSLPGTLMLLLAGIGWAKPVQVNPNNFRRPSRDIIWVSLAGPGLNLLLAVIMAYIWKLTIDLFYGVPGVIWLARFLATAITLNILFAFFNLIPIPPLDGSKIITSFLPAGTAYRLQQIEPWGFLIILGLMRFLGLGTFLWWLTQITVRRLIF
jgi:Zn-dependent protease